MSLSAFAPLLAARRFLTRETVGDHGRTLHQVDDSAWDGFYRDRWRYDKVVRSTHGVNCTGSCSWNVFVKDGLITWEHQATDYPTTGPDSPDYEPRGCPRGASFSWYEYSPSRVRHPYVRGCWSRCSARRGSGWVTRCWRGPRLVHVWSVPLAYLWRPYVVYRTRRGTVTAQSPTPAAVRDAARRS